MPRTDKLILLTGDYAQRLDALYGQAQDALEDTSARTMLDEDPYTALLEDYKALKAEAEAEGITVEFRSLGRNEWRDIKAKHPPRTEGEEHEVNADRIAGFNVDSVQDDLVFACVTSPEFSSRAAFDEWAGDLSDGEWNEVVERAFAVNGARFDPKSLPASPTRSTD